MVAYEYSVHLKLSAIGGVHVHLADKQDGKEMYTLALAAFAAGRNLTIRSEVCNGPHEKVLFLIMNP